MTKEELVSQTRIAAKRFCRGRSDISPEEVAGMAYLAVLKASSQGYRGNGYHKKVYYLIVDQLKKDGEPFLQLPEDIADQYSPPHHLHGKVAWAKCRFLVKNWFKPTRSIIRLVVLKGMRAVAVAEELNLPKYFVHDTINTFRNKLKGLK